MPLVWDTSFIIRLCCCCCFFMSSLSACFFLPNPPHFPAIGRFLSRVPNLLLHNRHATTGCTLKPSAPCQHNAPQQVVHPANVCWRVQQKWLHTTMPCSVSCTGYCVWF